MPAKDLRKFERIKRITMDLSVSSCQCVAYEATPFGAQRVNSTLYFGFSDHLGSTAVTVDVDGTIVVNELYKAWGGERYTWGSINTTFKYTGQRHAEHPKCGTQRHIP